MDIRIQRKFSTTQPRARAAPQCSCSSKPNDPLPLIHSRKLLLKDAQKNGVNIWLYLFCLDCFFVPSTNRFISFFKFENFGQDAFVSDNLHGKISANVNGKILMYPDMVPNIDKSEIDLGLESDPFDQDESASNNNEVNIEESEDDLGFESDPFDEDGSDLNLEQTVTKILEFLDKK